jgi:dTDP-4-amino-4,6-dideoxygalactose transaminase
VSTSFIIQKNLGCFGDGGALFTNRDDVNEKVRKLRNHGSSQRDHHSMGTNSRLDDLQAGVLSAKLKHITAWSDQRIQWAKRYAAGLKDVQAIALPYAKPGYRHVYHVYVIETKDAAKRDSLLKFLVQNGVDAKTHYSIPIHKQEGYPWGKPAQIVGSVANAEKNAASCVSLPMFPELRADEVDYVIEKVLAWDQANR